MLCVCVCITFMCACVFVCSVYICIGAHAGLGGKTFYSDKEVFTPSFVMT